MQVGDIVVRKSYGKDITFKIVDIKDSESETIFVLKGINLRILADAPSNDLEVVSKENIGELDRLFDKKVNTTIKKVLMGRLSLNDKYRGSIIDKNKDFKNKELTFGRPGKILHIDADPEYMNACLKVYKQLSIDAVGKIIPEKDQANSVVELIKTLRPDIVVITGHDGMAKGTKDYLDINNYKNSRYFVETVSQIRSYEPDYDDLVIFAGACQSCYEAILDAGAN